MDANGQRFWLVADPGHWMDRREVRWDPSCRALALASRRELPDPASPAAVHAAATSALELAPRTVDEFGGVARWEAGAGAVVVRSHLPDEAIRLSPAAPPTDLVAAHDGVLYLAFPEGVRMHDLRGRWPDLTVTAPDFTPWRLASDPSGGVWALDRTRRRLARLTGRPLTLGPPTGFSGRTFRPNPENCEPPTLRVIADGPWPAGERPQAIAVRPGGGGPALLSWDGPDGLARLWLPDPATGEPGEPLRLEGARFAYGLAFVDSGTLLVRVPGRVDAPAFDLRGADPDGVVRPDGAVYPLPDEALEAPFAHALAGPPRVPVPVDAASRGVRPLHPLSLRNLTPDGEARHWTDGDAHLLDSGDPRTVWHRLYADARIPAGSGFTVWCAATDGPRPPDADAPLTWSPLVFGEGPATVAQAPRAAPEDAASELPHHPGLGGWGRDEPGAGLWSVLIQDPHRTVRRVQGRYLWLRVELRGDGRDGPEIAALRAWASRFSYRDRYLPRLYRESVHGAPARAPGLRLGGIDPAWRSVLNGGGAADGDLRLDLEGLGAEVGETARIAVEVPGERWTVANDARGRSWRLRRDEDGSGGADIGVYRPEATRADFLERWLSSFEGVLTPMEDRIAHAHLVTDPAVVPEESLEWLASWIGVGFDPAFPADRRRAWLAAGPRLARQHGTRVGLEAALDVASGGGVADGRIIVIEDFRLRRLLATLLGVDLGVEDDPLLPGLVISGNSVVGDTLILGDAERAELLALFREDVATDDENVTVRAFHERLAHRATVLVHGETSREELGLVERVVVLESPAHADVRVATATWPLLVGVASLVAVDTWLGPRPPRRPARVSRSPAGRDFVIGPASLDPRLAGAAAPFPSEPPVADAGADFTTAFGASFDLDGSGSTAAEGRRLERYVWRRLPSE